jgi:hypothetical protein
MPGRVDLHREMLDGALAAIGTREFWSAFPEHFGPYGRYLGNMEGTPPRARASTRGEVTPFRRIPSVCGIFVVALTRLCPRLPFQTSMVRRCSGIESGSPGLTFAPPTAS